MKKKTFHSRKNEDLIYLNQIFLKPFSFSISLFAEISQIIYFISQ